MTAAARNWTMGILSAVLLAVAATVFFTGVGRPPRVSGDYMVYGACLACQETLEFEPARDEVIPFTCPKCDERAVYPWQYCYDCQMRFIPQPVRHQPGGPLKLPMHMSCPQCGGENVTGFVPGVPDQQPVGDYPLPQWSP